MSKTASLVIVVNDTPVTSSFAIAEGTDNEHASVIKLVRTYQADLEEFGRVGFQIEPFETAGGTQQREIALLNQEQATLLLTYMRNNEVVRGFKKRLVRAFFDLAKGTTKPKDDTAIQPAKEFRALYGIARLLGLDKNVAAISANNAVVKLTSVNVLGLLGQTHFASPVQDDVLLTATELGKPLGMSAIKVNKLLQEAGFQAKDGEHWVPTEKAKGLFRTLDTGKMHSDGTMIQQVKWLSDARKHLKASLAESMF